LIALFLSTESGFLISATKTYTDIQYWQKYKKKKKQAWYQHTYTHIYNSGNRLYNESVASCPGDVGKSIDFP